MFIEVMIYPFLSRRFVRPETSDSLPPGKLKVQTVMGLASVTAIIAPVSACSAFEEVIKL